VERIAAERTYKKLNSQVAQPKKPKQRTLVNTLSVGEQDLAREVKRIKTLKAAEHEAEERKSSAPKFSWDSYRGKPLPTAKGVLQIRERFGVGTDDLLSEWEKSWCKEQFVKYDKDKSGYIDLSDMPTFLEELKQNTASIGKVPRLDVAQLMQTIQQWPKTKENKVHWREFKTNIDNWQWTRIDEASIKVQIAAHYAKAQKFQLSGKVPEAKEEALKALRLEGLSTRSHSIQREADETAEVSLRADTFKLRTVAPRALIETEVQLN
jgi:hypothetical protein